MIFNAMPLTHQLFLGLALAAFCGCSAESGSSSGMGAGGHAGNNTATGGAGGSGSNTGGTGGNVSDYQPVSVASSGTQYTLKMGRLKMVVDASVGARITEFSFDGNNVLTGPDVDVATRSNYGSTFWTSPQSAWNWPPVAAIDNQTYSGGVDTGSNSIELVSAPATISSTQVTVTKRFVPKPESGAIDVVYTITNVSPSASFSAAPWQISRVAGTTGALTFFGKGTGSYTATNGMKLTDQDSVYWYSFVASPTADQKAKTDGAGWIAHATSDRLLLLFQYPDIQATEAAASEAEVELYTGKNGNYIEIEPQGAYTSIPPGGTLEWTVRWKLRQIDAAVEIAAGSTSLAAFAQQQRDQ